MIFVTGREIRGTGTVEQTGFEQHRAVVAVGHDQTLAGVLVEERRDLGHVGIVATHLPCRRRQHAAHFQPAAAGIAIGAVRRHPEIDADGGIVGMGRDGRRGFETFERPGLGERMRSEQIGQRAANLVDDLKQQWASEAVFQVGGDEAADVAEVVPDGAFEQIAPERGEALRRQRDHRTRPRRPRVRESAQARRRGPAVR